jgi:ubiquinone/menaquinone biosynthesis C-methylase UbiE
VPNKNVEAVQSFFERHAQAYAESQTHKHGEDLVRLVELVPFQPDDRVLDVATGPGHVAFTLAPFVRHVIGLDVTAKMGEQFEREASERNIQNVSFILGDVHRLPFEENTFDHVTCRRAAHHFSDAAQAVREMVRVLKPGGFLALIDMTTPDDEAVNAFINALEIARDSSHQRARSPGEWQAIVTAQDCEVTHCEVYEQAFAWERWLYPVAPDGEEAQAAERVLQQTGTAIAGQVAIKLDGERHFLKRFMILVSYKIVRNRCTPPSGGEG